MWDWQHHMMVQAVSVRNNYMTSTVPAVPASFDPKHQYEENPFMQGFTVPVRRKNVAMGESDEVLVNTTTGEVSDVPQITRSVEVDTEKFVKVYTAQLGVFFSLPSRAMQLAEVLLFEMSRFVGSDVVFLNQHAAEKYFKSLDRKPMSKQTYHRALNDLLVTGLIAYSDRPGLFFLNPHVFFNGNRVKFVTEYRKAARGKLSSEALEKMGQARLPFAGGDAGGETTDQGGA